MICHMRTRRILFGILLALIVVAGAAGIAVYRSIGIFSVAIPEALRGDGPGALVSVERTGKFPSFAAQYILNSADLPEKIDVTHGITLYRVQYRTTSYDGSLVVASGLIALPNANTLQSVVVYHHGTNAERRTAPSQPGLGEGMLMAAATAGTGKVLVAPDYIGLGESRALHPYMHATTTASTSIDLIHAARSLVEHLCGQWPTSLYLTGFSQGGHATFAVQRELEKVRDAGFEVSASAPIAGPFHLREISFPQALTGESSSHAFYLAYLANSYAHVYGQPLSTILTPPFSEVVPVLFDGDHTTEVISAALPNDPRELFNAEFLAAYDQGKSHWLLDALSENDVYDWTPTAPVRIYYGDDDREVLPEEARRAESAMKQRGADVRAISVGPCGHDASVFRAVPQAIRWFSDLDQKK
jgi:pimeloyl-ACP methyl ester carboxylesterase